MRVAVVGSRYFSELEMVERYIEGLNDNDVVVSGGAAGVDSSAEGAALARGLKVEVYKADRDKEGRKAEKLMNFRIVQRADVVVAFWDGMSPGTAHTIAVAVALGKPVRVVLP